MSSTAAAPRFVTVRRWWAWLGDLVRPASDAVRAGTECVSTLGWTVAVFGVVALVAGWVLGWQEFLIVGPELGHRSAILASVGAVTCGDAVAWCFV